MEFGPEDLVALGMHYLIGLAGASCVSAIIVAAVLLTKRISHRTVTVRLTALLALAPLVFWAVYVVGTLGEHKTRVLLDSESDGVAELVYNRDFKHQVTTLDKAISLAVDKHQPPGVRFYASCLVADLSSTNDETFVSNLLSRLDSAPAFETRFFGGNTMTTPFYTSGHAQPRLSVREIVSRRWHDLHRAEEK